MLKLLLILQFSLCVFTNSAMADDVAAQRLEGARALISAGNVGVNDAKDWKPADGEPLSTNRLLKGALFVIGVVLVANGIRRRYGRAPGGRGQIERRIKVLERTPISASTSLVLVEVDGSKVLVSLGSHKERAAIHTVDQILGTTTNSAPRKERLEVVCKDDLPISA